MSDAGRGGQKHLAGTQKQVSGFKGQTVHLNVTLKLRILNLALLNTPHLACINFSVFLTEITL